MEWKGEAKHRRVDYSRVSLDNLTAVWGDEYLFTLLGLEIRRCYARGCHLWLERGADPNAVCFRVDGKFSMVPIEYLMFVHRHHSGRPHVLHELLAYGSIPTTIVERDPDFKQMSQLFYRLGDCVGLIKWICEHMGGAWKDIWIPVAERCIAQPWKYRGWLSQLN
jgi:hypothetical protein